MSESDVVRQLKELADLRAAGHITEQEYNQLKAGLLAQVGTAAPTEGAAPAPGGPATPRATTPPAPQAGQLPRFCPQCGHPSNDASGGACVSCGTSLTPRPAGATGGPDAWAADRTGAGGWTPAGAGAGSGGWTPGGASEGSGGWVPGGASAGSGGWASGWNGAGAGGSAGTPGPGLSSARAWAESRGLSSERLVGGDWPGAVAAVLIGLGAMAALAGICLLIIMVMAEGALQSVLPGVSSSGSGVTSTAIGSIPATVTLAVGGSLSTPGTGLTIDYTPLGLAAVGFFLLALVFVRRLNVQGRPSASDVVLQAVRVWVVYLAVLVVLCVLARAILGGAVPSPDVLPTLVVGTVWLALVLAVAVLVKLPDVLPPRVRVVRDACVGPVRGVLAGFVVMTAATVLALFISVIVLISKAGSSSIAGYAIGGLVTVLLMFGPNLVVAAWGLGLGVPVSASGSVSSSRASQDLTLFTLTDNVSAWYWLLPVAALVAVLVGAVVSALHAASAVDARRTSWRYGVALTVLLTFAAIVSAVDFSAVTGLFGGSASGTVGPNPGLAFVVALLWGMAAGFVGAALAPNLPPGLAAGVRGWIASRGRPGHPGAAPAAGPPPIGGGQAGYSTGPTAPFVPQAPPAGPRWYDQSDGETQATPVSGSRDLASALRDLAARHAAGELTDQQFAEAKAALLGSR